MSNGNLGISLRGSYKTWVVDSNGDAHLKHEGKNLILNQGLDLMATTYGAVITTYAHAGTGTRANVILSGDSSGSVSNGFFYLYTGSTGLQDLSSSIVSGYTGSVFIGDIIKFANGQEITISGSISSSLSASIRTYFVTNSISNYSASIKENYTIDTQSFTIYKTSQTGLQNVIKRAGGSISTSSYLTSAGACGTFYSESLGWLMHRRTYDFSSESVDRTYSEIGFGSGLTDATIFSRILLPTTVSVLATQRLRLQYDLQIQYNPTSSISTLNAPIAGWPVDPSTNTNLSQSLQFFNVARHFVVVDTDGNTGGVEDKGLEILSNGIASALWISDNSQSLTSLTTARDRGSFDNGTATYTSTTIPPYVNGDYFLYKYGTFTLNQINSTQISSMGMGSQHFQAQGGWDAWWGGQVYACVFEQTQSKYNTQTLTLYFKWSWGRVLE